MEPLDFIQTPDESSSDTQTSGAVSKLTERIKSNKAEAAQKTSLVEKPAPDDNSQQIASELNNIGKAATDIKQMLTNFIESSVKQSPASSIVDAGDRKSESSIADVVGSSDIFGGKSSAKINTIPVDLDDSSISSNLKENVEQQKLQTKLLEQNQKILEQLYKAFKPDALGAQESEAETKRSIAEMLKTAVSDKKESDKKDSDADSSKEEEGGGFISSIMEMLGAKSLLSKGGGLLKTGLGLGKNLLTKGVGSISSGLGAAGSWLTGGLGLGGLMSSSATAALTGGLGAGAAVGAGAGVAGAAIGGFKVGDVIAEKAGIGIYGWAQEAGAMAEKAKKDAQKIKDPLGRALFELSALNAQAESEIQQSKGGFFGGMKGIGELLGLSDGAGVATEETLKAIEEKKKEVAKLQNERNKQKKQTDRSTGGAQPSNQNDSNTSENKRTREQQKYGYELDFVSEDEDAILADLKKENPDQEFDRWEIKHEKTMRSMENAKIKQDFEQSNPDHPEVVKMKKWREDYKKSVQGSSKGGEGVTSLPDQKQPTQENVKKQNIKKELDNFVDVNMREPSEQEIADIHRKHDQTPQPQPTKEDDTRKKLTPEQQWYGNIEELENEDYESIENDLKNKGRPVTSIGVDAERSKRQARNLRRQREFEKNNPNDPRAIKAREDREGLQNMMPKGGAAGGEGASNLMPARDSNEKQATKTLSANTGMKLDEITNQNRPQTPAVAPTTVAIDNSSESYVSSAQFRRSIQPEVGRMT